MKILIDARIIRPRQDGIGNYGRNLIQHLARIDRKNEYIICKRLRERITNQPNFTERHVDINPFNFIQNLKFNRLLREEQPDIVHFLYNLPPLALPFPVKYVFTVHDLMFLNVKDFFIERDPLTAMLMKNYMRFMLSRSIGLSDKIIAVSQHVKNELLAWRNLPEDKIEVIHHDLAEEYRKEKEVRTPLPFNSQINPFFLFYGRFKSYKNPLNIIRAMKELETLPVHFLFVGERNHMYGMMLDKVVRLGLEKRIHFPGYLETGRIKFLLKQAIALVFPSRSEGFGLPVLEAQYCRCPVITSNRSSLPEIAGDSALLVDPDDVKALTAAMRSLFENKRRIREKLIEKGVRNLKRFSWDHCAGQTLGVYESII